MEKIVWRAVGDLEPFPDNPRRHPEAQIAPLMRAIAKIWTNPILIDETATILAGQARLMSATCLIRQTLTRFLDNRRVPPGSQLGYASGHNNR
jgi:hypothetical protein